MRLVPDADWKQIPANIPLTRERHPAAQRCILGPVSGGRLFPHPKSHVLGLGRGGVLMAGMRMRDPSVVHVNAPQLDHRLRWEQGFKVGVQSLRTRRYHKAFRLLLSPYVIVPSSQALRNVHKQDVR